jgi:hypothetical protein
MSKRLPATHISNRLIDIPQNEFYCYELLEGSSGVFEPWHCPYFEGRISHAPIEKRWGRCNYLGVTEMLSGGGLLWDKIKHFNCPKNPRFTVPE